MVTPGTETPAAMAGLPGSSAMVGVGPPLFCSGPSCGSPVKGIVPPMGPLAVTTRLGPFSVTVAVLGWEPLTTLLERSTPPVELDRILSVIVAVAVWAPPVVMVLPKARL